MDKSTFKLLRKFYKNNMLTLSQIDLITNCVTKTGYLNSYIYRLRKENYISPCYDDEVDELDQPKNDPIGYEIEPKGRDFYEERTSKKRQAIAIITFSGITAFATLCSLIITA